jgi:hypothetical protein
MVCPRFSTVSNYLFDDNCFAKGLTFGAIPGRWILYIKSRISFKFVIFPPLG